MQKERGRFYVYCLFRPWNGEPCYIGKGCGSRYKQHAIKGERHENLHLANIFKRVGGELPVVIIHEGLDESVALEYEVALIAAIGRDIDDGPLVNRTDGGDGNSRAIWSDEAKRKKAEQVATWWSDPNYREKMCAVNRGHTWSLGKKRTAEFRAQKRSEMLGNQYRKGKKESVETSKHLAVVRGSPEYKANVSAKIKNLWDDPEYRAQQMASRRASEAYQNRSKTRKRPTKTWKRRKKVDNPNTGNRGAALL